MYQYKYPHPAVTTDCVVFGFDGVSLNVLLVERGIDPYKGCAALPGGFLRIDETAEQCAARELWEETGLKPVVMEQFHTFTEVMRDPRERVITIAFYALVPMAEVKGGDDAADARWYDIHEMPALAFDHHQILQMALRCLKERIHFEPVGFDLLPEVFKMSELQNLYEAILDVKFDRRNFYKKMLSLEILEQADPNQDKSNRRIPVLYKFNKARYDELKKRGFRLEF
jgi:8-oxo-dGTP diphosphatase